MKTINDFMNYDIIGDIHGHADELEILLHKLGYKLNKGVYSYPDNRQVIFLGDYIDRGPKIRETLQIVKNMCDAGNAQAIMGNHEFNAICFHTPKELSSGFFRHHSYKNINQHIETLLQFQNFEREWKVFLKWFKSLPLYIEEDGVRAVHACWDNNHIEWIRNSYKGICDEFLSKATDKKNNHIEYKVIEDTLKGKEKRLPEGISFNDKDGNKRDECRLRWWSIPKQRKVYQDVYKDCPGILSSRPINERKELHSYSENQPVFFGHYWLTESPRIENPKAMCLDYSVARGGKLVAYRFDENSEISGSSLIY